MKKEEFLKLVAEVHGDKFDYSLVPEEFQYKEKIPVVCQKHGVFYITVGNLVHNGRGCRQCGFEHVSGLRRAKTQEKFYSLVPILHDFKYDYSLCSFERSSDKIKIICPKHGVFEQLVSSHMSGMGCFKCGAEVRGANQTHTLEQFVELANEVHEGFYDYSLVVYKNSTTKVDILCPHHGVFSQTPANHLNKNGCKECVKENLRSKFKMSEQELIQRASSHFPDLDYSQMDYKNPKDKVKVLCPIHGEFYQYPRHLVLGHGCRLCGIARNTLARSKSVSEYISKFNEVHNNVYDYSKATGQNSKEKFIVICPQHGEFLTTVSNHIKGKGCPRCGKLSTGYRSHKEGCFYILKVTEDIYKFGISNKFDRRLSDLQRKCVFTLEVLFKFDFSDGHIARIIESEVIASTMQRDVINKCDMRSGYSETFFAKDLSRVLDIVYKNKPA